MTLGTFGRFTAIILMSEFVCYSYIHLDCIRGSLLSLLLWIECRESSYYTINYCKKYCYHSLHSMSHTTNMKIICYEAYKMIIPITNV